MSTSKTSRGWTIFSFVLSGLTVALALFVFTNRQQALDQLSVWSFTPSQSIEAIDQRVAFTEKGKFTFFATQPVVASREEFNDKCPRQEAGSPVLGCYTSNDRIYVFDINNNQLEGIEEVTAAHEMLHAVWQRTSQDEKSRLGALLTQAYERTATDELKERVAYYERTEPGEIHNELHSILGTEIENLGPELEAYYARYFQDRQKVLNLHDQYEQVYTSLYNRADALFVQMTELSSSIETRGSAYDRQLAQLSTDIDSFNERATAGEFNSAAQFNAERNALIDRSNQLEVDRAGINSDITRYNELYEEYQTIASQIDVLNSSMDSFKSLEEAPSVE